MPMGQTLCPRAAKVEQDPTSNYLALTVAPCGINFPRKTFCTLRPHKGTNIRFTEKAINGDVGGEAGKGDPAVTKGVEKRLGKL